MRTLAQRNLSLSQRGTINAGTRTAANAAMKFAGRPPKFQLWNFYAGLPNFRASASTSRRAMATPGLPSSGVPHMHMLRRFQVEVCATDKPRSESATTTSFSPKISVLVDQRCSSCHSELHFVISPHTDSLFIPDFLGSDIISFQFIGSQEVEQTRDQRTAEEALTKSIVRQQSQMHD